MRRATTSITITDPLVKYQTLVSAGLYCPDSAQHRLALHLQKIYLRLKDYSPSVEYRSRLKAISTALDSRAKPAPDDGSATLAVARHPIRRNPLFAPFFARTEGSKDSLALTRVLTSREAAIQIDSPKGLFLSGEVGTGKSMLLDLLADGLPTSKKRRWHYNTFLQNVYAQLEFYRKAHPQLDRDEQQYSLLWMAKDMIEKSPILFLDEFQLPDRAASKLLSNLFTAFFQLGGVLVASSNRMPEELEKASGFEYVAPRTGGVISQMLGFGKGRGKGELFGSSSDFASFLEVLKARCEFWQMEGGKDWRRQEADDPKRAKLARQLTLTQPGITAAETALPYSSGDTSVAEEGADGSRTAQAPKNYLLFAEGNLEAWLPSTIPWTPSTMTVYGRTIKVPRQHDGIAFYDFEDLVSSYGPAEYISLASTFHTLIVDKVPILTVLKKNEARRLITLLDALYEARCKLIVRAEVGPDDLFFPEFKIAATPTDNGSGGQQDSLDADAILPETIAEVYQDASSPFRPNISTYSDPASTKYEADQDSDSDFGAERKPGVDFTNTSAFTGEDERFAYKRATSRLWELCGERWHARAGDWWQPLPPDARHWEGGLASKPKVERVAGGTPSDAAMGPSVELDEVAGLQRFRVEQLRQSLEHDLDSGSQDKGDDAQEKRP